jgi:thioredoxin reductase
MLDVVVVGGGAAGLSAALVLGRSRRRTLVVDAGAPRNAPSPAAHSCFTRDGTPPAELLRIAREQLTPYDSVRLVGDRVTTVQSTDGAFTVTLADDGEVTARRVLLAVGVRDILPSIDGITALWGRSVLHCPYCHGWEVRDAPLALYAQGAVAMEMAPLLLQWSRDVVLLTGGADELTDPDRAVLDQLGVGRIDTRVQRVDGDDHEVRIAFADGQVERRGALFMRPAQELASDLPRSIGCGLTDAGHIRVGGDLQTSVTGVYAAGDATTPLQQIVVAAASGAQAAMMINRDLVRAGLPGEGMES